MHLGPDVHDDSRQTRLCSLDVRLFSFMSPLLDSLQKSDKQPALVVYYWPSALSGKRERWKRYITIYLLSLQICYVKRINAC